MNNFKLTLLVAAISILTACGGAEERKEVYLEKARQSLEAGDLDKARIELRNVLQIDPKEAQAHFQLGEIFDLKKDYNKAFASYLKAAELDPEDLEYHAKIGTYYLVLAGDIDAAIEKRDLILNKDPSNISGLLLKSGILLKQNNKVEAEKIAQGILLRKPGHVHATLFLSSLYHSDKRFEESINVLAACIEENPKKRSLVNALANAYFSAEKYDLAEKEYRGILEVNPEEFSNYFLLASFYKEIGDSDKAESVLRQAIEKEPKDSSRIIVLVEFIQQTRGNQTAIEELKRLIANNKNIGELQLTLARLYAAEKNLDEAEKILELAIADFSEEPVGIKSRVYLADVYMQKGKPEAANKIIAEAIEISPNDSEVNFVNAKLKLANKDYEGAIISLRIVTKDEPENIGAHFLLSSAHVAKGEKEQAEEIIRRAYENNRTNPKALVELARYYDKNRNAVELERVIDSLLSIRPDDYEILSYKSVLLNKKNMSSEAKQYAVRLIKLFPDMPNGYIQSIPYLFAESKQSDAISLLEDGYKRVTDNSAMLEPIVSVYLALKDFASAENKVQSAIREKGESAELFMLLARTQWLSGKKSAAKSSVLKASAVKPDWNQPYLNLADMYKADKNNHMAVESLQQGLSQIDGDLQLTFKLAEIHEELGEYDSAINVYDKSYKKHADNIILTNNIASLLSLHRKDEASMKRAKELADRLKIIDRPVILDTVGWVYYKIGNYAEAVSILKSVVENAPDVPVFNYHLGMALYKTGDEEEAKTYLTNALATNSDFSGKLDAEAQLKKLR